MLKKAILFQKAKAYFLYKFNFNVEENLIMKESTDFF